MSTPILRPYQIELRTAVYDAWREGYRNVMMQSATGSGKTVVFSDIVRDFNDQSIVIAHRSEIVSQISMALARNEVRHKIMAAAKTVSATQRAHVDEFGAPWTSPHAKVIVASVDTLIKQPDAAWMKRIGLVVQDEAHHVLADNKWGRAATMFPNAYGLYPTATPIRADGKGLGRHASGIIDKMVFGKPMRDLIRDGQLCSYKVYCPETDVDYSTVNVTAGGDLSKPQLSAAVHKSKRIVGDVVKAYQQHAGGKLGITFCVDHLACEEMVAAYRAAGISAEIITSDTPPDVRANVMRRFRRREILQLVNVDILGEGVDVPAVEVVSMVRRTESLSLYMQQFGRALRLLAGKTHGIIIDHVGNFAQHGPPDKPRLWSLDDREAGSRSTKRSIEYNICLGCTQPYEAFLDKCPHCGALRPPPAGRGSPEQVEGNIVLLDDATIAELRGEISRIDGPARIPSNITDPRVIAAIKRRHWERQQAQKKLRDTIALWAGYQNHLGRSDTECYRAFYLKYGVDIMTAQALNESDAEALQEIVNKELDGIVSLS